MKNRIMKTNSAKKGLTKTDVFTLLALGLALFVIVLDGTIMNVSMKAIMQDLGINPTDMQGLITAYSLVLAAFTLIGARLGDIFGRKKVFLFGAGLFTIGALLAANSVNGTMLFIGWSVIEGLGAALMMPATISLMATTFTGEKRAMGFGVWGGVASVGASIGPLIGGYLTTYYSWRYAFWLEILPLILVFWASKFINDDESYRIKGHRLDLVGSFFSATGFASLIYGIVKASEYGWFYAKLSEYALLGLSYSFWFMLLGIVLLAIFILVEKRLLKTKTRTLTPLIDLSMFKSKQFVVGIILALTQSLVQAGVVFVVPMFLLLVKGYTAIQIGVVLLPITLSVMIFSIGASKLSKRPKLTLSLGFVITSLSAFLMSRVISVDVQGVDLIVPFMVFGAGLGLIVSQLTNIVISSFDVKYASEASGINSTFRRLGAAFGTAIMGTILFTRFNSVLISNIESLTLPTNIKTQIVKDIKSNKFSLNNLDKQNTNADDVAGNGNVGHSNAVNSQPFMGIIKPILDKSLADATKYTLRVTAVLMLGTMSLVLFLPNKIRLSK